MHPIGRQTPRTSGSASTEANVDAHVKEMITNGVGVVSRGGGGF